MEDDLGKRLESMVRQQRRHFAEKLLTDRVDSADRLNGVLEKVG